MDLARVFARGLPDDDPDRDHEILNARLSIPIVALVCVGKGRRSRGRGCTGRSFRYARLFGADWGNGTRERPRASARSDATHRDACALPPASTHLTTRFDAYLDVPSFLERTVSARCRLLVHVNKPPVLSEARRLVL